MLSCVRSVLGPSSLVHMSATVQAAGSSPRSEARRARSLNLFGNIVFVVSSCCLLKANKTHRAKIALGPWETRTSLLEDGLSRQTAKEEVATCLV